MTTVKEKPAENHIGKILFIEEATANRVINRYKRYIEAVKPYAAEIIRIGLSPLDNKKLMSISAGDFKPYLEEFLEKANADTANVGFVFKPVTVDAINKGITQLEGFLEKFRNQLRLEDELDCPFENGYPVITPEFQEEVKERYTFRIKTKQGSDFYAKFLVAQSAIKDLMEAGGRPEYTFEWDRELGLRILTIPE